MDNKKTTRGLLEMCADIISKSMEEETIIYDKSKDIPEVKTVINNFNYVDNSRTENNYYMTSETKWGRGEIIGVIGILATAISILISVFIT